MSNIEGYILVASPVPGRCSGCAFHRLTATVAPRHCGLYGAPYRRLCSTAFSHGEDVRDSIYIADTDEGKARYAAARLGVAVPDGIRLGDHEP